MTAKGHVVLASALAYIPITYLSNNGYEVILIAISYFSMLFGSLLPDIDEPKSYIGDKFNFLAQFLQLFGLKHRTVTHWLITPILIVLIGYQIPYEIFSLIVIFIGFGVLAHDIGDLITKGGIVGFLYPVFSKKRIVLLPYFLRFETFSVTELFFILSLWFLNIYLYLEPYLEPLKEITLSILNEIH